MTLLRLYFGRDIPGRPILTDEEWQDFVATTVAPQFPDGFTVLEGEGEWRSPSTGRISREKSKIIEVAIDTPDFASRAQAISNTYRSRFRQEAVGRITHPVCGGF